MWKSAEPPAEMAMTDRTTHTDVAEGSTGTKPVAVVDWVRVPAKIAFVVGTVRLL
jgi:hypothetical protein